MATSKVPTTLHLHTRQVFQIVVLHGKGGDLVCLCSSACCSRLPGKERLVG